jgi:glycerol-3-phosphate dehydrogenase
VKPEIAIVGAGYVGVPLAHVFADAGRRVVLVDVVQDRVDQLNRGESYIEDIPSEVLGKLVEDGLISATSDYDILREVDAILIALPTPLSRQREPDLSIVLNATREVASRLRGQDEERNLPTLRAAREVHDRVASHTVLRQVDKDAVGSSADRAHDIVRRRNSLHLDVVAAQVGAEDFGDEGVIGQKKETANFGFGHCRSMLILDPCQRDRTD